MDVGLLAPWINRQYEKIASASTCLLISIPVSVPVLNIRIFSVQFQLTEKGSLSCPVSVNGNQVTLRTLKPRPHFKMIQDNRLTGLVQLQWIVVNTQGLEQVFHLRSQKTVSAMTKIFWHVMWISPFNGKCSNCSMLHHKKELFLTYAIDSRFVITNNIFNSVRNVQHNKALGQAVQQLFLRNVVCLICQYNWHGQ